MRNPWIASLLLAALPLTASASGRKAEPAPKPEAVAPDAPAPEVGKTAPAFSLPADDGSTFTLADHRGKTVVLVFFPKAFTGGWTKQLSAFRDDVAKFAERDAQVVGVSTNSVETQKKFRKSLELPFPLLADEKGAVAKKYGVYNAMGYASRVTFVIGPDGVVNHVEKGKLDTAGALGACPLKKPDAAPEPGPGTKKKEQKE